MQKGNSLTIRIYQLHQAGKSPSDIAGELGISFEEAAKIIDSF